MNLKSCYSCGVVVDFDSPGAEETTVFNHDGDKYCHAVKCPVCKESIPSDEWKEYT